MALEVSNDGVSHMSVPVTSTSSKVFIPVNVLFMVKMDTPPEMDVVKNE